MTFVDPASMWIETRDQIGAICWYHKPSGCITYSSPSSRVGLTTVPHPPNSFPCMAFFPGREAIEDQWEEHTDDKTKTKYWYNKVTKKSTWENPKQAAKKPPPPPAQPAPPAKPAPSTKKEPKVETREQDLWSRKDDGEGGKVWFNSKTKKSQRARPDCLKKYR